MDRLLERYCHTDAGDARIDWMVLMTGTLLLALAIVGTILPGAATRTSQAPAAVTAAQDAAV
ncbi:MAG: hypothetical protein GC146_01345 [Limimaricola sp.]|uniref:hypothetical protein n=1 Tax=Limimaricola sp. TaxID=2211665 RepID=UPI001D32DDB1|nr:hypothetical protein [Limimaricola sp.]MBI1415843.1 hypothetical protein [Limimaricola sp.]